MTPSREGREAARALNMKVAVAIGWTSVEPEFRGSHREHWFVPSGIAPGGSVRQQIFDYSSDVASAFLVVEAMRAKGFSCRIDLRCLASGRSSANNRVQFTRYDDTDADDNGLTQGRCDDDSLPLAVCHAALAALTPRKSSS